MVFNIKSKREKELIEHYQEKINEVRNDLLTKLDNKDNRISEYINTIDGLIKKNNELTQKVTNATIKAENDFHSLLDDLDNERKSFKVWAKNEEDKLKMKENNLNELAKTLKENSEQIAKAKFADMITNKFDKLVQAVVDAKSSETLMLGDTTTIKRK